MSSSVAVVILNWNGISFLKQFLPTVVEYSSPHTIIVADNASTDDSVSWVKMNFPQVRIIQNNENGGFAKGYNDALKLVETDFYLLLNSDVEVTENWLVPLLEAMQDPEIGGCQPKIKSFHSKDSFEYAGAAGGFIDRYHYPFCRGRMFDDVEKDNAQYDFSVPVFWASGACMLIRAELYWKAGGLDERFFAHMEEIDLCWRIQHLGYRFLAVPASTVYHVGGGTLNYNNPRKTFLNFRNNLLMIHKNQGAALWWVLVRRLALDGIAALVFLLQGKPKHFWAIFTAHLAFYRMIPSSKIERKKWKAKHQICSSGVYDGSIIWANKIQKIKRFTDLNQRKMKH